MGRIFKHITVGFLIANLGVSTTGVTLHMLYCLCKGERTVSLFSEAAPYCLDVSQEQPDVCCKADACRADDQPEKDKHSDCTHSEKKFVKLDVKFSGNMTNWTPEIPVLPVLLFPVFGEVEYPRTESAPVNSNKPPPPRLSGRALLVNIQTFLC